MERTCLSAPSFPPRGGLSLIPSPKWPLVAEQVGHRAGREDGRPRLTSGRPGPRARPSALSLATPLPRQLLCEAVVPQRVSHRDGLAAGQLGACRQRWEREPGCETPWRAACPSPSAHIPVATRSQRGKRQSARGLVPARHEQTRAGGPDPVGEATLGLRRLLTCSWPYAPQATPRVIQMPIPPLGRCPRLPSLVSLTAWVFFLPLSSLVPCSPSGKRVAPQWGLPGTRLPGP